MVSSIQKFWVQIPKSVNNTLEMQSQMFIYFSFVTQSTLGYGDITPVSNVAKTLEDTNLAKQRSPTSL